MPGSSPQMRLYLRNLEHKFVKGQEKFVEGSLKKSEVIHLFKQSMSLETP